jgi:N-acetylglucosaminyldiphosphoundecaprenol N-acetyl-beta-D-mannosaminyltransferase
MAVTLSFLGIRLYEDEPVGAVSELHRRIGFGDPARIYFVNAHCVNVARRDRRYQAALAGADFVLPDGSGVLMGARLLGLPIRHNLNGTDLVPMLLDAAAAEGRSVFLFGGRPGVADAVAARLRELYAGLRIVGTADGYADAEDGALVERINAARPDVLLVALGVPQQELWIDENWERLNVRLAIAVGGLFDFMSGRIPRAPVWLRKSGLEWSFRLLQEPRRLWRRYLIGNVRFVIAVLMATMRSRIRLAAARPPEPF